MATLHDFIPQARLREHDEVSTPADAARAFEVAVHLDLARSPLVHALFWLRTLPERLWASEHVPTPDLHIDAIGRGGQGFMVLDKSPGNLVVGAIGRFWETDITFAPVTPAHFAAFNEPGWGKVAWQLSSEPTADGSRISFDVWVTATDDAAWQHFVRYFRLIGPFSRFIRRQELQLLARDLGGARDPDAQRKLPGDELIPAPKRCLTDAITIDAAPEAVWPWLVQMGCGRGGWYSYDWLDNAGVPSARTIRPDLQTLRVGDVLAATPNSLDGFSVLAVEAPHSLVLGGLFDTEHDNSLPMDATKPEHFRQVSWAFALEPMPNNRTRLYARVRADYGPNDLSTRLRVRALALVHHFMERAQLKHLKARAERSAVTPSDVVEAAFGAAEIAYDLATPFQRHARCHWGMSEEEARRAYPGDDLIPAPRWQWTHALDIDAPRADVWPWIVQLGQQKGGFYSYQALENLVGCEIRNADRIHPEWQDTKPGDPLRLHPKMPPLEVREVVPEAHLLVSAGVPLPRDAQRFVAVSWLFQLVPLPNNRTRLISRYRCDCSGDLGTRLAYGPYIAEAVGFVMDRRMLIGIAERVER